ncbi:MAG: iron-containing redox enzyme family protein [Bdellovibrionota bacterium]
MNNLNSEIVFNKMLSAIDDLSVTAAQFPWEQENYYANWLAQSFFYVQWTTRQLALASAKTKPIIEDNLHWRFIEEAKEEKRHELLALQDLKNLGYSPDQFPELPHTSFFYQTLSYLIENEHPIAILGYSLTLEGFAAKKLTEIYPRIKNSYDDKCVSFVKLHCEVDVDHFDNALPYLKSCPNEYLPLVAQGVEQCRAIYNGILTDIRDFEMKKGQMPKVTPQQEMSLSQ